MFRALGDGSGILVDGTISNNGTFQHVQSFPPGSKDFLHFEDASTNIKYRGATITSTSDLGNVTVTQKMVDRSTTYCTDTDGSSPIYANRCFEITADTSAPATLKLWALTSEVDPAITNPSLFRYAGGGVWNELTTNPSYGTDGVYTYAEADTSGFSHFLIAEFSGNPNAVSLQSFTGANAGPAGLMPIFGLLLFIVTGTMILRKKRTAEKKANP